MGGTYKATGINLKSMPMGESDRLLTILTREFGLVRAVAMGSRKHNSQLGGRSSLFVVNQLLIAKGRSLDKVAQAETLESYPGLGQDLKKLTASQYLAELCLCQALSDQPQEELFFLLNEHLKRLEQSPASEVLPRLVHAIFQLLALAGIAPQVFYCCLTRQPLTPDREDPRWRAGFSIPTGGVVTLKALEQIQSEQFSESGKPHTGVERRSEAERPEHRSRRPNPSSLNLPITAAQLTVLQQLPQADLFDPATHAADRSPQTVGSVQAWLSVERLLRQYSHHHFDRAIRSASLIDACFLPSPAPFSS